MKKILISLLIILLVGCVNYKDNFTKNLNSTGAYIANNVSNTISQYYVDSSTYKLTTLGTVPTGTSPTYVAMHPNSKFVYAVNSGSGSVSVFSVSTSTRKLSLVSTTTVGTTPVFIIFNTTGTYAYVANTGDNSITSYSVTTSTGALTAFGIPYMPGCAPTDMAIAGSVLYAACGTSIISYVIDSVGGLSSLQTSAPAASASIIYITPNPSGNLLLTGQSDGSIAAITIDGTGAMSAYAANAITGCTNIYGIYHNSGGTLAWVLCKSTNNIISYTVSGTNYTSPTTSTVGTSPTAMAFAGSYAYAYVVNSGDNAVGLYSVNSSTGALTLSATIGTDNTPTNLVGY